jgi:hypothetical protein
MMSDNKIAKTFLSAIIDEKIIELDFASTERTLKTGVDKSQLDRTLEQIVICHLNFVAKIQKENGEFKTVIIVLQKEKIETDIFYLRHYLGEINIDIDNISDTCRENIEKSYRIYLLNYDIGYADSSILVVESFIRDQATNEVLDITNDEFIKSLTYKSWYVQLKQLKEKGKNDLENLLSIFYQGDVPNFQHVLNINPENFSKEHKDILNRLQEAYASSQIRAEMQMEDDYLKKLL